MSVRIHTHTRTQTHSQPTTVLFSHTRTQNCPWGCFISATLASKCIQRAATGGAPLQKSSTHTNTHNHIHKHKCVLIHTHTHTLPQLHLLTAEVDYSRLWLSGRGSRLDDFVFLVVVTPENHNKHGEAAPKTSREFIFIQPPPSNYKIIELRPVQFARILLSVN